METNVDKPADGAPAQIHAHEDSIMSAPNAN